jgi:hypothetical protein
VGRCSGTVAGNVYVNGTIDPIYALPLLLLSHTVGNERDLTVTMDEL